MALRDPELMGHLGPAQVAHEPEIDDLALALPQNVEGARQQQALVAQVGRLLRRLVEPALLRPAVEPLLVEDSRDLRRVRVELPGYLGWRRAPPERRAQLRLAAQDAPPQLVQRPREPDRTGPVPQMAPDLTHDGGHRVRGELSAALEVEAVDGVDEPDRAGLEQVVVVLAALVAMGEGLDERQVHLDQLLARTDIAVLAVGAEQAGRRRRFFAPGELSARVFHRLAPAQCPYTTQTPCGSKRRTGEISPIPMAARRIAGVPVLCTLCVLFPGPSPELHVAG